MNVLSLFDGISAGQVALNRAGIEYDNYYSSEIDKNAIAITQYNYPKTIQLGDIREIDPWQYKGKIDLILAGSPCVDFSSSKQNRQGLKGDQSRLFWNFAAILKIIKPKYFLFENVASMPKIDKDTITEELGVESIFINSSLVSALNRPRLYWTNIPNISQPKDQKIYLSQILEPDSNIGAKYYLSQKAKDRLEIINRRARAKGLGYKDCIIEDLNNSKFLCLDANYFKGPDGKRSVILAKDLRKATPLEAERLQTFDDNYTKFRLTPEGKVIDIADTNRYKALGNSWTIEVITHILKKIK